LNVSYIFSIYSDKKSWVFWSKNEFEKCPCVPMSNRCQQSLQNYLKTKTLITTTNKQILKLRPGCHASCFLSFILFFSQNNRFICSNLKNLKYIHQNGTVLDFFVSICIFKSCSSIDVSNTLSAGNLYSRFILKTIGWLLTFLNWNSTEVMSKI